MKMLSKVGLGRVSVADASIQVITCKDKRCCNWKRVLIWVVYYIVVSGLWMAYRLGPPILPKHFLSL